MYAFCWSSGVINIAKEIPEGAIKIFKGTKRNLKDLIIGTARLAYGNETWLIPGIPESNTSDEALDALAKWLDWIKLRKNLNVEVFYFKGESNGS